MGCAAHVLREVAGARYGAGAGVESPGGSAEPEAGDPNVDPLATWAPPPVPSGGPSSIDPDVFDDVGDEVALLAAHLHAGMYPYLMRVAWIDRMEGWRAGGHRSCAHWLAVRTGHDHRTAREHVRVARALEALPKTGAALARGALSFSKVRALSRAATAETEADLLEVAEGCTANVLERVTRAWKKHCRQGEADLERERHRSRRWDLFPDADGTFGARARFLPEGAHMVRRAVELAEDHLYREQPPLPVPERERVREASRRRADAVVLMAERILAVGFGGSGDTDDGGAEAPISGSRADRYQVLLHVEPETLSAEGEPGISELEDGSRVTADAARRIACDAGLVRVETSPEGEVLNVGRKTRTIPPALRRALEVRDRGCRFPGCGCRFADAHHVVHWADGGETSLKNTILLCRFHHRLVHEGGWTVEWWGRERQAAFLDPRGHTHLERFRGTGGTGRDRGRRTGRPRDQDRPDRRRSAGLPDPRPRPPTAGSLVEALIRRNRLRGAEPHAWTAGARWDLERHIPDEISFRATEAAG